MIIFLMFNINKPLNIKRGSTLSKFPLLHIKEAQQSTCLPPLPIFFKQDKLINRGRKNTYTDEIKIKLRSK